MLGKSWAYNGEISVGVAFEMQMGAYVGGFIDIEMIQKVAHIKGLTKINVMNRIKAINIAYIDTSERWVPSVAFSPLFLNRCV